LLTAYNDPSRLTVHRVGGNGAIAAPIAQQPDLDTGIYAHQILATPSNRCVVLVTRGNNATAKKPEDPGAIKTFAFADGKLRNLASIAPGNGLGFGPRHLDFHPTKPRVFVSIERQNKLYVYELNDATGLSREPIFIKETLSNPKTPASQGTGAIHVHANGKFVYLTNRTFPAREGGREVSLGGEDNLVVYALGQNSGEPKPIQHIDGRGVQLRTFGIDASGRLLCRRQHHADVAQRRNDCACWNDRVSHRRGRHACSRAQIRCRSRSFAAILERNARPALIVAETERTNRDNDADPA
jgi:6-phosphogluconolactonase